MEPARGEEVVAGAREACHLVDTEIIGGDLTASPGPLVLDVVVLGRAASPALRSGSRPGDELWVTGWLGGSAAAVDLWTLGQCPPAPLRDAFVRPIPRIREALWLAGEGVIRAAIDLSDGLAGDAGHLAAASGVEVVLEEKALPLHPGLRELLGESAGAIRLALSGGEDYELCFTVTPGSLEGRRAEAFRDSFHLPLTRVGRVQEGAGVTLEGADGALRGMEAGGFVHFQEGQDG
jgi:thiamine-monophosphate kinase